MDFDVAIIGGGPAGSTTGAFLKKYDPKLRVAIFEREQFPRDHVGESQLPGISGILDEMGCWDKVEAANFPIKLGGTYRWGKSAELWDVAFYPTEQFVNQVRPGKYEGQRRATAFQVDRSIYDEILLDHAKELGCEVHEGCRVTRVHRTGNEVSAIELDQGETANARHFVDASGHSGILRRAMSVATDCPTSLQNVAIWDYWQNAEWAVEIGVGGTFIQVLSIGYGWIWFIPLGPSRTSVGLVIPAEYLKSSGQKPADLYERALQSDERIARLMRRATSERKLQVTKDWSFVAERHSGLNWFLVGESGGFADPILSAGLTITHAGAREAAFTILELERGKLDPFWLREQYDRRQRLRICNHIKFADYWYTANSQMSELKEHVAQIAAESGLELDPEAAWDWLARGGFIQDDLTVGAGGFSVEALRAFGDFLMEVSPSFPLEGKNVFELDLRDATWIDKPRYYQGAVQKVAGFERGGKHLTVDGHFETIVTILQREKRLPQVLQHLNDLGEQYRSEPGVRQHIILSCIKALEALVFDGWVKSSFDPAIPLADLKTSYLAIRRSAYDGAPFGSRSP